ncbi:peptidoglycan-binding protein [Streptomyces bobili]|uniref:peptidoglycan-binding protein n=1 Tax=Streptomyces bobili TaxID=67280 RepID=UPI00339DAE23
MRRGRRLAAVTAVVTVAALGIVVWGVSTRSSQTKAAEADADRVLFSAACRPVIALGQQDECVKEAQRLLRKRGADIGVDGIFGPQTRLRVTAFQVFAGITPNGVVADPTKKALYESKVRLGTWSPEKVRGRIREVFTEAPDVAVAIADCQSFLDPLHILPNTDGTRNWGLFQISDLRLRELGGTPSEALDPEWNIQAAKKLWSRDRDFHHWQCARALPQASPSRS